MKVALISDTHFGIKKSDSSFQESQLKFFEEQLVPTLKKKKIKTILVLGDIFDTRQNINVQTQNVVINLFKNILKDFDVRMIVGNHDLYYTTTTNVNSLKCLNELTNVTVYEQPELLNLDGHDVLMLPWITNYNEEIKLKAEYCFAHLDIISFNMDKINICTNGITIKDLLKNFKHVYTGHFHTRSKKIIEDCSIEYIGSPYQLTRIDAGQDRGCTILDLDTNKTEFIVNTVSSKYVKLTYPVEPDNLENIVKNNIVDIEIPYEYSDNADIHEYISKITVNAKNVNTIIGKKADLIIEDNKDLSNIDLFSLFKAYTDQLKLENKDEIYTELINLYNEFKGE